MAAEDTYSDRSGRDRPPPTMPGHALRRPLKALRVAEPGLLEVVDVPAPFNDDQVLVRIHQVGIRGLENVGEATLRFVTVELLD